MPEIKNIFVGAKMNKDLNPRMISNKEYIDARNAAVINSEGSDSGLLQNVSGNALLTDFGLTGINLEVVGFYIDTTNNRLFAFITDWNDVSNSQLSNFASQNSHHYICVFDTSSNAGTVLVSGSFLNFSKTHPILGINLLEDLLFFTDNRNQPRKINIKTALFNPNYYSKEEHISVAKYYPYNAPRLVKDKGDGSLLVNSTFKITSNVTSITDSAPSFTTGTFTVSPVGGTAAGFRIVSSGDRVLGVAAVVITGNPEYYVGENFNVGDKITIPSGTLAGQVGDLVFVVSDENMAKEGTMKDVVSKNLPATETLTVDGAPASLTEFNYSGTAIDSNWIGSTITATESDGESPVISVSDNIKITNIVGNTITHDSFSALSNTDIVTVGANPYYNSVFTGDSNFLTDKFARFSYRFKYDDGEYSLIAPFSQIAFIPKQDGYFLEDSIPESVNDDDANSDENNAIKSTIISFFENKVNSLELVINMPEGVNTVSDLINDLKVSEIDIVYKQSDQNTIKIIDTINRDSIITNLNSNLVYTYNSQLPIRTLPSNETTRASDKVPIRAKSQEVASNRVMYGNYLVRTARPNSLDYSISCSEKSELGQLNSVNEIEYPNHTLKQNRSYKVGIVLADKFGRQSDVITSLNSTVYNPYIGINPDYIINPDGISTIKTLGQIYRGDSLKTTFLLGIPEQISASGYAGLYSETNPTGWYSYKIVVQQREQEYYNVYLPTILNNNPQDGAGVTSTSTAFITLFSDNINKVPRDLKEAGPLDIQFSSSVELYPRISNSTFETDKATTQQISTSRTPDKVISIGTRDELGLDVTLAGADYDTSPFYSIPLAPDAGTATQNRVANLGANPYIGSIATEKKIGAVGGDEATVTSENVRLNVYETEPFESVLDIYYETGDSGLIADLNEDVKNNDLGLVPAEISDWTFVLNESYVSDQLISTTPFDVLNFQGVSLTSLYGADVSVEILQVVNENDVILDSRIFKVVQQTSAPFKFELKTGDIPAEFVYRSPNNSYSIFFKLINTNSGFDYTGSYNIPIGLNRLANSPIIETTGASIEGPNIKYYSYNGASIQGVLTGRKQIKWNSVGVTPLYSALDISIPNQWVTLQDFEFENGASFDSLQDTDLYVQYFSFTQGPLYFMNPGSLVGSGGLFFDETRDYTDKLRIRKIFDGSTIKYRLEYSEKLRPYNDRATTLSLLYQEPPPNTESDFLVQLTLADATTGTGNNTVRLAGSLGMSTANIADSRNSLFVYQFKLQN